jgi:hypothetical protein
MRFAPVLLLGALVAGCVADPDLDPTLDTDAAAVAARDSHQRPTVHGPIVFATAKTATLTAAQGFHAWTFELHGPADVTVAVGAVRGRTVDTWLYLYREGATGWGSYLVRRDHGPIVRALGAGRYRVLVKGQTERTRGAFSVTVDCAGAGCAAAATCVFGDTYRELDQQPALRVTHRRTITSADDLTDLDRRRVVRAVQQSSHTDVTTAEEALARVDQGELNRVQIYEPAAARTFVAMEYGAGDSSYGAYFDGRSDEIVARIHDGDVLDCAPVPETCLLGGTFRALQDSPAFEGTMSRRITAPGHVVGVEAEQALRAVQESYGVATLADGLAAVDGGQINIVGVHHRTTGTSLIAFEYGAGDSSYGRIFYGGSLALAAAINDGDLYGCTFFASRGDAQVGDSCGADDDCAGGLICAGATRGAGLCQPASMRGTFADPAHAAIPDGGALARTVAVSGLATVDTDVEVRLELDHPRPADLRITLTNPAGTEVVVNGDGPVRGFSGDESVNGAWTLRV